MSQSETEVLKLWTNWKIWLQNDWNRVLANLDLHLMILAAEEQVCFCGWWLSSQSCPSLTAHLCRLFHGGTEGVLRLRAAGSANMSTVLERTPRIQPCFHGKAHGHQKRSYWNKGFRNSQALCCSVSSVRSRASGPLVWLHGWLSPSSMSWKH